MHYMQRVNSTNTYNFTDNKYTKWYFDLIQSRLNRTLTGYVEKHHIVPRSLNGNNVVTNIVPLTAREHFILHLLLIRMVQHDDVYKMVHAIVRFGKKVTSSEYELLRMSASRFSKGN